MMKHVPTAHVDTPKSRKPVFRPIRVVGAIMVILIMLGGGFVLGVGYGQGTWSFGRDGVYRASEQKDLPEDLDYKTVEQLYDKLKSNFDGKLDQAKLLDGIKSGMVAASGDPYTEYFNAEASKDFNAQLDGTFSGIGAELGKDANGNVVVISPIAGFPAEKAGLKAKDIIAEIDGKSTAGMTTSDAVTKIRGKEGTSVKLTIVRGAAQELTFTITRQQIKVPSVTSEVVDGNIGYVRISRFGDDTSTLMKQVAAEFTEKNVAGVVLDMRGNPGGLLDAAVDVSSLWLQPGKTVLQEKRGGVVIRTFTSSGSAPLGGKPTVVLLDEGSASASEITAGALRDNKAATIIGVKSYGKGSVQSIECLTGLRSSSGACPGSSLKVTIARWFTPAGVNIDKQGIEPDQKVERTDDNIKNNQDPQKDAALNKLRQ